MLFPNLHIWFQVLIGITLRKKCPYSGFFWTLFSSIGSEYGSLPWKLLYSVPMRENTDQKNSEYGRFSFSDTPWTVMISVLSHYF